MFSSKRINKSLLSILCVSLFLGHMHNVQSLSVANDEVKLNRSVRQVETTVETTVATNESTTTPATTTAAVITGSTTTAATTTTGTVDTTTTTTTTEAPNTPTTTTSSTTTTTTTTAATTTTGTLDSTTTTTTEAPTTPTTTTSSTTTTAATTTTGAPDTTKTTTTAETDSTTTTTTMAPNTPTTTTSSTKTTPEPSIHNFLKFGDINLLQKLQSSHKNRHTFTKWTTAPTLVPPTKKHILQEIINKRINWTNKTKVTSREAGALSDDDNSGAEVENDAVTHSPQKSQKEH